MPLLSVGGSLFDLNDTGPRNWGHSGNDWATAVTAALVTPGSASIVTLPPTSASASAGNTIIRYTAAGLLQASVNGGRFQTLTNVDSKVQNVLDYGAKGDGITDDTAAIQAAIVAAGANSGTPLKGGCVFLPAGTYKITSTLSIRDLMNFRLCGASKGLTRIVWAGTTAVPRWQPSTAYATGATMMTRGFVYTARTGGTTSAGSPPTSWTTGAGGFTDGTVVWDYTRPDTTSDMLRVESYQNLEIHDIEFTGFASTTDQTKRPRAMICSYVNSASRTYACTALIVKRCRFNTSNSSGLPNMADIGVMWDWGNSEFNNSEGYLEDLTLGCCGVGIQIDGTQSQDHTFIKTSTENTCGTAIQTFSGSFAIRDSNLGCTPGTGTIFNLGQNNDRILIDHCVSEDAGRLLVTGGNPAASVYGGSPWTVTIRNYRFAMNNIASDGKIIIFTLRGPLVVENCVFEAGVNGITPKFSLATSGRPWRSIVRDCAFNGHWPNNLWTSVTSSLCDGAGPGCIETGNTYVNYALSTGADSVMRSEMGTSTFKLPTAWAQSTAYAMGATVTANGALYVQTAYPSGGTSAATGTGPSGQEEQNGVIPDGTGSWIRISDPTTPVLDSTQYYTRYEVPMPGTYHAVMPVITTRTGTSAASVFIKGVTKYKHGHTITLSSALTGTDSIVVDWAIRWP